MKLNGILPLVVTVLAVVLLTSACVVPIVQSAQSEQRTVANNIDGTYAIEVNSSSEVTLTLANSHIVINGVEDSQSVEQYLMKVYAKNLCAMVSYNGASFRVTNQTANGTSSDYTSQKIIYSNGIVSCYDGDDTLQVSVESDIFLYPDSNGTYAQYNGNGTIVKTVSIDLDSKVYIGKLQQIYGLMAGTIEGFETVGYVGGTGFDTSKITFTPTVSDDGLSWKFATNPAYVLSDSTEQADPSTSSYCAVYVPIEYHYMTSSQATMIVMLGIIPMLLFLIPIMLIVRSFGMGRD